MRDVRLIVITGLPGTGKTTLARHLAARYGMPVIGKDMVKEPLRAALPSHCDGVVEGVRIAQVLCQTSETDRLVPPCSKFKENGLCSMLAVARGRFASGS